MRKYILLLIGFFTTASGLPQGQNVPSAVATMTDFSKMDSLESRLKENKSDTATANLLGELAWNYVFNKAEKALHYGQRGIALSQELGYKKGKALNTRAYAMGLWAFGNYNTSLQFALDALHQYEELEDKEEIAFSYYVLACVYRDFGDYENALTQVRKGINVEQTSGKYIMVGYAITGSVYELQNQLDSADYFIQRAYALDMQDKSNGEWGWLYTLMGNIQRKKGNYSKALSYYHSALPLVINNNISKDIVDIYNSLATLYRETGKPDSCIFYASEVIRVWSTASYQKGVLDALNTLSAVYKSRNERDSAMKYLELSVALNNKLFNQENERDIQQLAFKEQLREDEIVKQRAAFRNQLKMYALLAIGGIFLVAAILLWRNNQQRKKAYSTLQNQKLETDRQKAKVEQTLVELKTTQAQLVQSEKMASLGELTAGIAHEIQNPLNFVNNFSEVNTELIDELQEEIEKGNTEPAKAIANDIKQNLDKITHHGKRADAIVKGMLLHSRSSSGQKEPTDINALADEYLRLAYHGLRAKDKSFQAKFETSFDSTLQKLNIVPQEIGRVLLNLINNAFYAVTEKKKREGTDYEPCVLVSTKKLGDNAEIRIKDNGDGISQGIIDKIFQPFFTTKPTGQGTGLGLSMSYDIVKAHQGELKVISGGSSEEKNAGTEFIIVLPI